MLGDRLTAFIFSMALALLLLVLELVRRRLLAERYSLLWLAMALAVLLLAAARPMVDRMAALVGISYPPSALFVAGFGAVLVLMLYLSAVITKLSRQNRIAAQRIGLLDSRLRELERPRTQQP
ncbi:hypothetical protein LBMAG37_08420 [Anaerolineae bacterium]|jgi:hypothetical protein|nr:hypothetical protein EMGBS3_02460 [Anaerolineaceae bacterium]GBL37489.1 hypothetical protein EMGBD1_11760 [Anaerolineaceae bacterium]GDX67688.1 hypothetical protein LBMAG37_08420 [Anaerolineae bacterium]